jgi:hypothetical protein
VSGLAATRDIRRALGWALVAGLCVAALTACVALLSGSFDDTDAKVVFSSLGFAIFSAFAAAGATLRAVRGGREEALGTLTAALGVAAFLALLVALWVDWSNEELWRLWGILAILALAGSHASVVLKGRRPTDTEAVRALAGASLVLGVLDAFLGELPLLNVVDEELLTDTAQVFGVLLVLLVLTTALAPIVRRLGAPAAAAPTAPPPDATAPGLPLRTVGAEIEATAARIAERTAGDPALQADCARLVELGAALRRHG